MGISLWVYLYPLLLFSTFFFLFSCQQRDWPVRLKLGGVEGSVMRDEKNERPNGGSLEGSACAETSVAHGDAGVRLSAGLASRKRLGAENCRQEWALDDC